MIENFDQSALLLIGHGSSKNGESGAALSFQAKMLKSCEIFKEVKEAYWQMDPLINDVLPTIQSKTIYIVPFFLSEGYFTQQVLPRHLGLRGRFAHQAGKDYFYCRPVGVHPKIDEIINSRMTTILTCEGAPIPQETCLFIAGHGTNRAKDSSRFVLEQVKRLQGKTPFAEVKPFFLDQAPYIKDWRTLTDKKQIAVIPYFLSDGLHVSEDIPALLGFSENEEIEAFSLVAIGTPKVNESGKLEFTQFIMKKRLFGEKDLIVAGVEGRKIWYTRSLGREPMMANIILDLCDEHTEKM
ncbi:MAG: CbiX/SirB N-terminal domain-containing protein [Verrucomicrobiota bacterium]|nr:CbiX/SirB N-terminal domain-containing protein [Verrucomicrobiota bacterium]